MNNLIKFTWKLIEISIFLTATYIFRDKNTWLDWIYYIASWILLIASFVGMDRFIDNIDKAKKNEKP